MDTVSLLHHHTIMPIFSLFAVMAQHFSLTNLLVKTEASIMLVID